MEFLIDPLSQQSPSDCKNQYCPNNEEQCGCNTVQGCACPKS